MSIPRFLEPRLTGARFEGHAIPLEFLRDLAVLEEMIIEVAKAEFLKDHGDRKRSPRGFMEGVEFKLTGVEDGSARPVISLVIAGAAALFPPHSQTYFERARDAIMNGIAAAEQNLSVKDYLPEKTLGYFDRIGRSLREGEAMEFDRDGAAPARLTPQTRRKLVLAAPGVNFITDDAVRRGAVVDTNDTDGTFTIRLAGGQEIQAPLSPEHRDVILDAQKDSPVGVRVAVRGVGRFSRSGKLVSFESIEEVTALDPLDVPARLDELRGLKAGWLDGDGAALDPAALDKLGAIFTAFYPDELPLPYTFPTESGGVQFEWRFEGSAPEIEIDLSTLHGEWLSDHQATIDLNSPQGWAELIQRVSELIKADQNGEPA